MKRMVIGCDNAAVSYKNALRDMMISEGYEVEDAGVDSGEDPEFYPLVAARLCRNIADSGYAKRGVLLCGTGIGMAMTANKFPGIRAAQVHDAFSAERAALSNDANVITMGARVIGMGLAKKILAAWLPLRFKEGPSSPKVEAMIRIEGENFNRPGRGGGR